ncbi:MAG: phosphotransferase family protein [Acidimicrobiia bacterium]
MSNEVDVPKGIDAPAVEAWLLANVERLRGPLRFSLISGGHSNITYFVDDAAGYRCVMRRPPLAKGAARANDVGREYRVMKAIHGTKVPVPEQLAHCTDESVNGAEFYVMACLPGHVVANPSVVERVLTTTASRQRASEQIVDVMADMHTLDVDAIGLGAAAKREAFLDRQLTRMSSVWESTKTRELPLMDAVQKELFDRKPEQRYTGIVHSDYRMGNVMFDESGTLTGVLDWELWTLGDVLADVAFLLNNWYEPGETGPNVWMEIPPTMAGGFWTREQALDRYRHQTGFDLSDIDYYRAFSYWKHAVLAEGVKRRYDTGAMASSNVDFAHLNQRVIDAATFAAERLGLAV